MNYLAGSVILTATTPQTSDVTAAPVARPSLSVVEQMRGADPRLRIPITADMAPPSPKSTSEILSTSAFPPTRLHMGVDRTFHAQSRLSRRYARQRVSGATLMCTRPRSLLSPARWLNLPRRIGSAFIDTPGIYMIPPFWRKVEGKKN